MSDPLQNNQILAELQEDYRREQFQNWMKRYGGMLIVAVLLVVAGTGGYSFWKQHKERQMQDVTAELYKGLGTGGNPAAGADTLKAFADAHPDSGQAVLAALLEAGLRARADQPQEALVRFDAVINNAKADEALKGAAAIAYVETGLNADIPANQLQARLAPYQAADSAFRFSAWELGALVAHKDGDSNKAQSFISQLLSDSEVPPTIKARATELQRVL